MNLKKKKITNNFIHDIFRTTINVFFQDESNSMKFRIK